MRKLFLAGLAIGIFLVGLTGSSNAAIYTEDFEANFPSWESGWLGSNSNIQNVYGVGQDRGNNPDGLWIADGNAIDHNALIIFSSSFGASITSFSIDLTTYIQDALFTVYDLSHNILYSGLITSLYGAYSDPGTYQTISLSSLSGLSGFSITGSGVEGNTSIDNVVVETNGVNPVPEPTTMILFGTGIASLVGLARKRKN